MNIIEQTEEDHFTSYYKSMDAIMAAIANLYTDSPRVLLTDYDLENALVFAASSLSRNKTVNKTDGAAALNIVLVVNDQLRLRKKGEVK